VADTQRHDRLQSYYAEQLASWSDIREQMPLLYEAAAGYEHAAVAELGTRTGLSTSALLAGASLRGGHVWSVDCGPVTVPDWWASTGTWSFLAADDLSGEALAWVPAQLDVLFIDTSHLYDHTLAELRAYAPRVRPGGIVMCHDTELRRDAAVMRRFDRDEWWLDEAAGGPEFPVAAALDTYCAEAGLQWVRQGRRPEPAVEGEPFYGLGAFVSGAQAPQARRRRVHAAG
jgi:predicted O-methyltransferase YrrM